MSGAPRITPLLRWPSALAVAAAVLASSGYTSRDPDASLYAHIAAELSRQPLSRWIAPEWWGGWNNVGLFREHPVGIFLLPAAIARLGFPAEQATHAANLLYQALAIALIPAVAAPLVTRVEARSLAWILQLIPIAFSYRLRATQEPPMLVGLLALLYATERARTQPVWIAAMAAIVCALVLIKAAFVVFAVAAAVLWLVVVPAVPRVPAVPGVPEVRGVPAPRTTSGGNRWPIAGLLLALACAAAMVASYEITYQRVTGQSFLAFYGTQRVGGAIDLSGAQTLVRGVGNIGWYLARLMWFAFPWSLCAVAAALHLRRRWTSADPSIRGLWWALLFAATCIAVLSPAAVRAERFIFPCYFAVAAAGAIAANRRFPSLAHLVSWLDRFPSTPVLLWLVLFLLRLAGRFF